MSKQKLTVSYNDLSTPAVDAKVQQMEAIAETRRRYETAPAPQALIRTKKSGGSIWYNAAFHMAVFGLVGAILGWAIGQLMPTRPTAAAARDLIVAERQVQEAVTRQQLTEKYAAKALADLKGAGQNNPYYLIQHDSALNADEKAQRLQEQTHQDWLKDVISNVLFYGVCGLTIALALGAAEGIVGHNLQSAIMQGAVGAMLGLVGGVIVSLFVDRIYDLLSGTQATLGRKLLARAVSWGVLGLFLSVGPGVAMRNAKRFRVGLLGGLIGGLLGGALYAVAYHYNAGERLSRLVGIMVIGLVAGLGTGLIEQAAKSGWLRVVQGLIAGKQFVLYRNPTYIGSAPQCQIYLFKDNQIGKRHAAIHVLPGGFELEDLPLGTATLVNGQPITRVRLRNGDQVQVGSTGFVFQEKIKK